MDCMCALIIRETAVMLEIYGRNLALSGDPSPLGAVVPPLRKSKLELVSDDARGSGTRLPALRACCMATPQAAWLRALPQVLEKRGKWRLRDESRIDDGAHALANPSDTNAAKNLTLCILCLHLSVACMVRVVPGRGRGWAHVLWETACVNAGRSLSITCMACNRPRAGSFKLSMRGGQ